MRSLRKQGEYCYRQATLLLKEKPFLPDGNCSLLGTLSWCQTRMCFAVYIQVHFQRLYLFRSNRHRVKVFILQKTREKEIQTNYIFRLWFLIAWIFYFFLIGYQFYCFGDQNEAVLPSVYKYLCTECHFFQVVTKCLAIQMKTETLNDSFKNFYSIHVLQYTFLFYTAFTNVTSGKLLRFDFYL